MQNRLNSKQWHSNQIAGAEKIMVRQVRDKTNEIRLVSGSMRGLSGERDRKPYMLNIRQANNLCRQNDKMRE